LLNVDLKMTAGISPSVKVPVREPQQEQEELLQEPAPVQVQAPPPPMQLHQRSPQQLPPRMLPPLLLLQPQPVDEKVEGAVVVKEELKL
jgi:hypothetical protein